MQPDEPKPLRQVSGWWWFPVISVVTICFAATIVWGPLNQDEGWYLYAARQVVKGQIPHRDFFFTQGLIMPCVYAVLSRIWSPWGVLGGRILTACFGGLTLLCACWAIGRLFDSSHSGTQQRRIAQISLVFFLGANLWWVYFMSIPKTYALCSIGMAGVLTLLVGLPQRTKTDVLRWIMAGILLAVLTGIRMSMGIIVVVAVGWFWIFRSYCRNAWVWLSLGVVLGILCVFGIELVGWPKAFWDAQRFHMLRASFGVFGWVGCIARIVRFNPVLIGVSILLLFELTVRKRWVHLPWSWRSIQIGFWGVVAIASFGVHVLAPVPYDDYQIPTLLPWAMCCATGFSMCYNKQLPSYIGVLFLCSLFLTIIGSPMAQDWVVAGQDRFWICRKTEPDLIKLRRAGNVLRQLAVERGVHEVWTQDTYVAVEAGLDVPKGLEMGPFSPAPENVSFSPRLAAWSGYTFALHYPDLRPAQNVEKYLEKLNRVYARPLAIYPQFGKGYTTLTIAERNEP